MQALLASLGSLALSFFNFFMYILCVWQNDNKTKQNKVVMLLQNAAMVETK